MGDSSDEISAVVDSRTVGVGTHVLMMDVDKLTCTVSLFVNGALHGLSRCITPGIVHYFTFSLGVIVAFLHFLVADTHEKYYPIEQGSLHWELARLLLAMQPLQFNPTSPLINQAPIIWGGNKSRGLHLWAM